MADLTAKVLGYRYWKTDADDYDEDETVGCGLLCSQGYGGWAWGLGVNEAQCTRGHGAPGHDCQCGLHAYFEPQIVPRRGPFRVADGEVYGCVRGWGRMEVHTNGYRAQYAEIVALAYNEHLPRRYQNVVKALARDYEVECVPLSRLTAYAIEQADPMPAELIPEKPKAAATKDPTGWIQWNFQSALAGMQADISRQLVWGAPAAAAVADAKRPEDIGLHSVQPGDVLKYGNGEPPF